MLQQLDDVVPVGPLQVIGVVAQDFDEVLVCDPHGGDVILGVMAAEPAPGVEEPAALFEGDQALVFAPGDVNQVVHGDLPSCSAGECRDGLGPPYRLSGGGRLTRITHRSTQ